MRLPAIVLLAALPVVIPPPEGGLADRFRAAGLIDARTVAPTIAVDLKYATPDNIAGRPLYDGLEGCWLRPEAAGRLARAQEALERERSGFRLVAFDCARTKAVQAVLRAAAGPGSYVAGGRSVSLHTLGMAVDCGVLDREGQPLDMGTPFDLLDPLSEPRREAEMLAAGRISPDQIGNRRLLRRSMAAAGFIQLPTEWWHFNALPRAEAERRYGPIE